MIFCIFGGGKCRPRWGVQRGLPLALLGNFQRYVVLRLGKFPNKLWYFLRKYPEACLRSVRCISVLRFVPTVANVPKCACHSPVRSNPTSPIIFSLSVGGWRGGRFRFQRLLLHGAAGYKVFPINTLAAKREEDLSGNGAAARPFSRHKAPCLLCLCKRE